MKNRLHTIATITGSRTFFTGTHKEAREVAFAVLRLSPGRGCDVSFARLKKREGRIKNRGHHQTMPKHANTRSTELNSVQSNEFILHCKVEVLLDRTAGLSDTKHSLYSQFIA